MHHDSTGEGPEAATRRTTARRYWQRSWARRRRAPAQALFDLCTATIAIETAAALYAIAAGAQLVEHPALTDGELLVGVLTPMAGITLGHTVLLGPRTAVTEAIVRHEACHVADVARLGGLGFYGWYGADSLWRVLRGQHHYRDNRFEVAARQAERAV